MSREFLRKLANYLKTFREEKGLTLEQIYGRTRIDVKYLQAIEAGHFDILPEVYMNAFIKEYAENIGLDPKSTLQKYELAKKGLPFDEALPEIKEEEPTDPEPPKIVFEQPPVENSAPYPEKSNLTNKNILYGAIGAAIVIVLIIIYFAFIRNSASEIIIETPFEEIVSEQNKRFEISEPELKPALAETVDSLKLTISAFDTAWVSLLIDSSVNKEYIMIPNTNIKFTAANFFDIVLGNSGGVKLFLDGNELEFRGRKGSRRSFKIDKSGIANLPAN